LNRSKPVLLSVMLCGGNFRKCRAEPVSYELRNFESSFLKCRAKIHIWKTISSSPVKKYRDIRPSSRALYFLRMAQTRPPSGTRCLLVETVCRFKSRLSHESTKNHKKGRPCGRPVVFKVWLRFRVVLWRQLRRCRQSYPVRP
jgi:hypothetical protein